MALRVAIIGGGPAGAVCAHDLAAGGARPVLFERDIQREKPCGGGLTWRAFQAFPELAEFNPPARKIRRMRVIGPGSCGLDLMLPFPVYVVSRRDLDQRLRRAAIGNGAELIQEAVHQICRESRGRWLINGRGFDVVVGAGGINDPLARCLGLHLDRRQRVLALGSFVTGSFAPQIICRFFPGIHGYAWWFPREDHASLGIEISGGEFRPQLARKLLSRFLREDLDPDGWVRFRPYCWTAPLPNGELLESGRFCGSDWLLVGDAAGLADAATGEGLCHALASGRLAAQSILENDASAYSGKLKEMIIP